jgi:hypothetical protein
MAQRAMAARARVLQLALSGLDDDDVNELERLLDTLLESATVDVRAAMAICRLCDAHACGHFDGSCPVTRAADRHRASA